MSGFETCKKYNCSADKRCIGYFDHSPLSILKMVTNISVMDILFITFSPFTLCSVSEMVLDNLVTDIWFPKTLSNWLSTVFSKMFYFLVVVTAKTKSVCT